jgi:hypothetical protein
MVLQVLPDSASEEEQQLGSPTIVHLHLKSIMLYVLNTFILQGANLNLSEVQMLNLNLYLELEMASGLGPGFEKGKQSQ